MIHAAIAYNLLLRYNDASHKKHCIYELRYKNCDQSGPFMLTPKMSTENVETWMGLTHF